MGYSYSSMILMLVIAVLVVVGGTYAQTPGTAPVLPSTLDQWTVVVGVLLPLAIAVINRHHWPSGARAVGALVLCGLAAAGELYFKGQLSMGNWVNNAVTVFFIVVTSYKGFWQPTGIADTISQKTG